MSGPIAVITLCDKGLVVARQVADELDGCDLYVHESAGQCASAKPFASVVELTREIFGKYTGLVYVCPTGVVVRAIAPCIQHKTTDPAIVAVDVGGRWAVSLLSGHEGGANELAVRAANALDAEPVISTTTEAEKTIIAGVGCRQGVEADAILAALSQALAEAGKSLDDLRLIASADIKRNEAGLIAAAEKLGVPLRFISSELIRECSRDFEHSQFVQDKVSLPAVAEPAALLAGRRTKLLLEKQIIQSVTVALATENCLWSA